MKIVARTKKDFEWVNYSAQDIKKKTEDNLKRLKEIINRIKAVKKEDRSFENTVLPFEEMEKYGEDNPLSFIHNVSSDEKIREASRKSEETFVKEFVKMFNDVSLYESFIEYSPKKGELNEAQRRLHQDLLFAFKRQGLDKDKKTRDKILTIDQKLITLEQDFSKNIANYHDFILCTKEELKGLPESFINNLEIDKKTGKFVVTLAYPEIGPFMNFAEDEKKRKEIADKAAQKGGRENIKILREMLKLRHEKAKLLGFDSFSEFVLKDKIAKRPDIVENFLSKTIRPLHKKAKTEFNDLQKYVKEKFPGKEVNYYNSGFLITKMEEDLFSFNTNEVKEFFEINNVIEKMFNLFGGLFKVSFKKSGLPVWNKEVLFFDVLESGKVVGHIAFDLYPRKNKYSHMACWNLMPGYLRDSKKGEYIAPASVIVGNFPKGSKEHPSLLSVAEVETLFHEFGHMMHGVLSRAEYVSQSGTGVTFDFVEMPSQLFENWVRQENNLIKLSRHYKTGKSLPRVLAKNVIRSLKFMEASSFLRIFVMSLQDHMMHTKDWKKDPLKLDKEIRSKYFFVKPSPKSLFPAAWGHLTGYAAKYYSYMWSLVYSYDIFSRFEKEGIMNKKVGMELRRKILEKGDSEDPIKLMKDFLGRKPNNKAFLKAIK